NESSRVEKNYYDPRSSCMNNSKSNLDADDRILSPDFYQRISENDLTHSGYNSTVISSSHTEYVANSSSCMFARPNVGLNVITARKIKVENSDPTFDEKIAEDLRARNEPVKSEFIGTGSILKSIGASTSNPSGTKMIKGEYQSQDRGFFTADASVMQEYPS